MFGREQVRTDFVFDEKNGVYKALISYNAGKGYVSSRDLETEGNENEKDLALDLTYEFRRNGSIPLCQSRFLYGRNYDKKGRVVDIYLQELYSYDQEDFFQAYHMFQTKLEQIANDIGVIYDKGESYPVKPRSYTPKYAQRVRNFFTERRNRNRSETNK